MPTQVLRPNGTSNTAFSVTGAASEHAATSDDSDTTYFTLRGVNPACVVDMGTFSLPAEAAIDQIRVRSRARYQTTSTDMRTHLEHSTLGDLQNQVHDLTTSWVTYSNSYYTPTGWGQSDIDALQVQIYDELLQTELQCSEIYIDLDYALRPGTPTVSAPTGTITTTRRPLVDWAFVAGTDGPATQSKFRVKIFDAATYGGGGFDPDTSSPYMDSGVITSSTTAWTPSSNLPNNETFKAYVQTYATLNGVDQKSSDWGASPAFAMAIPIPTPTNVQPYTSTTYTTPTPALDADGSSSLIRTTREWQIASDTGFTTNLQTFQENVLRYNHTTAGAFAFNGTALAQGTWYVRARFVGEFGTNGSYASYNTFTVSHPPAAALWWPTGGVSYEWDATPQVFWNFSDDYPSDDQTAYQVELWVDGLKGSTLVDSTKTTSTTKSHTFGTLSDATYKNVLLRIRVKVWDVDDVAGAWSNETTFYLRDLPTATITYPATVINEDNPTVTWTFTGTGAPATTQAKYRVRVTDTTQSVVVEDSGTIASTATSYVVSGPVIIPGNTYSVQLDLTDSVGLIGTDTNSGLTTTFSLPDTPTFYPDGSSFLGTGGVRIDWSGSTADANLLGWKVYRRLSGLVTWKEVYDGSTDANTRSFVDYTCPAGQSVEYGVTQIVDNLSGGSIESATSVETFQGECDKYFLVSNDDPTLNIELFHVTGDNFSDEKEMTAVNLIGRGRRIEYGTRFGRTGQLTAQIRDTSSMTARQQRLFIEEIRNSGQVIYLRSPFGDVWEVALSGISFTREAGVGTREFGSLSIDYTEVTA